MRPEEKYPKPGERFLHMERKLELCYSNPPTMEHEFGGWRELNKGRGGEQFCKHCGMGAMTYSLRIGDR
jgi:hypothetical protein